MGRGRLLLGRRRLWLSGEQRWEMAVEFESVSVFAVTWKAAGTGKRLRKDGKHGVQNFETLLGSTEQEWLMIRFAPWRILFFNVLRIHSFLKCVA